MINICKATKGQSETRAKNTYLKQRSFMLLSSPKQESAFDTPAVFSSGGWLFGNRRATCFGELVFKMIRTASCPSGSMVKRCELTNQE
jgi:hypothetical protein